MKGRQKYLPKMAFLSAFLLLPFSLLAQNPDRLFVGFEKTETGLEISTSDGRYFFRYFTPEIVETAFIPSGQEYMEESHAVVLEPLSVNFSVSEEEDRILIDSEGLDIEVSKRPFQVTYFFNGEKVISEKTGYLKDEEHEKLDFNLSESEVLMGGGARALGMNRRGNRLELYNRAHYGYETKSELLNFTLPIVLSSEKYLLHFDNAPIGFLDLDSNFSNTLTYETIGGRKTYQLVVGDTWEDIVGNYTLLTGRQPLPPRWALGNFSSRFGYHSREEVEETIEKFREEEIPVDAVIIDLFWFGHEITGTMGNLEFVIDSFPRPEEMMQDLAQDGVKTILVTEPFVLTTSNRWEEAVQGNVLAKDSLGNPYTYDFYFGNTGLIDIFEPQAQEWFWNIYEELTEMGVGGWWGDLGEPELHPEDLIHATGTANEVHNIYGHYWAKLIHEGYERSFTDQRPFILMRAGAAGSQRFGLMPWSGDVNRSWGGLKPQPEISLQMGLQGLAYMHSDLGGFAGDNLNDELYVRWLQYGVFQPVYRPHAQEEVPSEPVFREPETMALSKKAIELRYKLLPYNYTLAFRNSTEGVPLMRPLFFEEPENFRLYSVAGTYLWGDNFLVSPVLRENVTSQEVYFPKGSNWFNFYTGEKYSGGSSATIQLKEEYIPTFVRGGAFIPMAKPMQTTQNFSAEDVELHYFFDTEAGQTEDILYHDDGKTPETYLSGEYEILYLKSNSAENILELNILPRLGAAKEVSEFEEIDLIIHNLEKRPEEVRLNNSKIKFEYDQNEHRMTVPVNFKEDNTSLIIIN
ncbi:TIM-barrel domain-containing protein [Salinimicrobium terrae]|uniref:glycoside hydrolase family 31 protein n=1 Tax=Salinimicrobium terrae TaxID=470866 RepID=UPI0004288F60|nr:TIM-barrel domain-containing protein [Salinimicrobium terrae]